jgi:hypothetical protein
MRAVNHVADEARKKKKDAEKAKKEAWERAKLQRWRRMMMMTSTRRRTMTSLGMSWHVTTRGSPRNRQRQCRFHPALRPP